MRKRYPEVTVSNEGIISDFVAGVGRAIAAVGAGLARSAAIGAIAFESDYRPEVNGVPSKSFNDFISTLKRQVSTGEPFDVTLHVRGQANIPFDTGTVVVQTMGDNGRMVKEEYSGSGRAFISVYRPIVILGAGGNQVVVRLPGFDGHTGWQAKIARFVMDEVGLKL